MSRARVFAGLLAITTGLLVTGNAAAEELSRKAQQAIKQIDANYGDVVADPELCKGEFPASRDRDALNLHTAIDAGLYFAQRAAKGVPEKERSNPEVAKRLKHLADLEICYKKIAARRKVLKKELKLIKKRWWDFQGAYTDYSRTMDSLVSFAKDPDDTLRRTADPQQLQKWKDDLDAVHALCTGKFKGIVNDSRYGTSDKKNPEVICKAAAMREHIIKKLAINYASKTVDSLTEALVKTTREVEEQEGYIRLMGTMSLNALYKPQAVKEELGARFASIFGVAGITQPDELWGDFDKAVDTLWGTIVKLGPTWKSPKKDGSAGAAKNAAKNWVKSLDGGAKMKKAYLTRKSWNIIKKLGVPVRRTRPGFVIYKTKTDKRAGKLCRGRSFTYAEEYVGRKPVKSKTIKELGFVRFQPCK